MSRSGWTAAALLVLSSAAGAAEVRLTVNPEWAGRPMAVPSAEKTNRGAQHLRITRLSALLSEFALRRGDGSQVVLPGRYGFIDGATGQTTVILRGVEPGRYTGLAFTIGLPAAVDRGDASRWPAGHPLNPLTDGLYWGWQGGYVFAAIEGNWWAEAGPRRGFSYHLAAGAGAMRVQLGVPFEVRDSTAIRCAWDVAAMLRPLEFEATGANSSTHSRADDALAQRLAGAAVRAVGWRGSSEDGKAILAATEGEDRSPLRTAEVPFVVPAGFPQPNLPADNPLTRTGIELGKALFTDKRLSGTGRQACVACHQPGHGFSDSAARSIGAGGATGLRHSPPLVNLAWEPAFAWDGSQPRIRDQARRAIASVAEMNADLGKVCARLAEDERAARQFERAFGSPGVTAERVGLALEQYLLTLVSADSKFDRAARGEAVLTGLEKRGLELFLTEYDPAHGRLGADCFHCHGGALFGDYAYRDNGLGSSAADRGRAGVTGSRDDEGKFKTPSLRDAARRAPYMHDGSLPDLMAVVAHYTHGVRHTANLDPNLGKHPDEGMALSVEDQAALVAFLTTLSSGGQAP